MINGVEELKALRSLWREQSLDVALVPTMGNLHAGHLRLVEQAVQNAERIVVSVFVNPTQFLPGEDYQAYPRTLDADAALLRETGAHVLFTPTLATMYPGTVSTGTRVSIPVLDDILCGASRPGHFTGVATVVSKLFNLVEPDLAVFGDKDYQQLLLIRAMVRDLCFPIRILAVETVREDDGLAVSSRNAYLSAEQRVTAASLYRGLKTLAKEVKTGNHPLAVCEQHATQVLEAAGFEPDYVSIRCAADLGVPRKEDRQLVVMAAASLGDTRLIDHLDIEL